MCIIPSHSPSTSDASIWPAVSIRACPYTAWGRCVKQNDSRSARCPCPIRCASISTALTFPSKHHNSTSMLIYSWIRLWSEMAISSALSPRSVFPVELPFPFPLCPFYQSSLPGRRPYTVLQALHCWPSSRTGTPASVKHITNRACGVSAGPPLRSLTSVVTQLCY